MSDIAAVVDAGLPGLYAARISPDGQILASNQAWKDLLGDAPYVNDIVDQPIWQDWPEGPIAVTAHDPSGTSHGLVGTLVGDWIIAHQDESPLNAAAMARIGQELDDLLRDAIRQREGLRGVNDDLKAMIYGVSHDLRAPVRHATLTMELLVKDAEIRQKVKEKLLQVQEMIDRLVNFGRAGFVQLWMQPFSLDELVRSQAGIFSTEDVTITWESLGECTGDKDLLGEVLGNLLQNSVKYRSEEPLVVHVIRSPGALYVEDNGVGVTPSQAETMFDPFTRHSTKAGHGLGLAWCRKIMEKHGGNISAQPLEQGCRIVLWWPGLNDPEAREMEQLPAPTQQRNEG